MGYSWVNVPQMIQIVSITTVYGLTALTFLWTASITALLTSKNITQSLCIFTIALSSLGGTYIYGQNRLQTRPIPEIKSDIDIRVIPGNIPQNQKWKRDKIFSNLMSYINASKNDGRYNDKPVLIVWPETTMTNWYYQDKNINGYLQDMLATYPKGASLITGALRQDEDNKAYNSIIEIQSNGSIRNIYNKTHLVPFGEYIPFQKWIPLDPVNNFSGFQEGDGPEIFSTISNTTYAPAVCYEIIFPHSLLPAISQRPDYIINATNDAWHTGSAGPNQHYTQAVFRAIEYHTPVIRSANMGISGIISPYGNLLTLH